MSGGNNVLITDTDLTQAQRLQEQTLSLPNIGNDGTHIIKQSQVSDDWDFDDIKMSPNLNDKTGEPKVRTSTANVQQTFKNINLKKQVKLSGNIDDFEKPKMSQEEEKIADADNQAIYKDLMREIENPAKPPRNMAEALDTLWTIESYLDEATQEKLNFRTDSVFWGTFKNAFCKFLGLFSKSFAEKRTQELNDQINVVVGRITDEIKKGTDFDKNLQQQILVPILDDDNIDEELKTTCLRLFSNEPKFQKELFQEIKKPSSDVLLYALEHWKKEIKNGKLFGNDVCDRWLSPLMNDENTTKETKLKLYSFFENDPEIQDKLFRSLKKPPNEIREQFWEKHKEKIVSGKIFGFSQDRNPYGTWGELEIKDSFLKNEYPLATLFLTMTKARRDLDKSIFEKTENWKLMQSLEQQKEYLKAAHTLTSEHVIDGMTKCKNDHRTGPDRTESFKEILNYLKGDKDFINLPSNPTLVLDVLRNAKYSFTFGDKKIEIGNLQTEDAKIFFEKLKEQIYDKDGKCQLNEDQLKRLTEFICYSPSQGYNPCICGMTNFTPFAATTYDVKFEENGPTVVKIQPGKPKAIYEMMSILGIDPSLFGFAPYVKTSGNLVLTYKEPLNAENQYNYNITIENFQHEVEMGKCNKTV